jgi:hypothetical protein
MLWKCTPVCGERGNGTIRKKELLPQVRERSRGRNFTKLEGDLDGQLNAAGASATQERVADADVTSGA